jgi:hypothetical protein
MLFYFAHPRPSLFIIKKNINVIFYSRKEKKHSMAMYEMIHSQEKKIWRLGETVGFFFFFFFQEMVVVGSGGQRPRDDDSRLQWLELVAVGNDNRRRMYFAIVIGNRPLTTISRKWSKTWPTMGQKIGLTWSFNKLMIFIYEPTKLITWVSKKFQLPCDRCNNFGKY